MVAVALVLGFLPLINGIVVGIYFVTVQDYGIWVAILIVVSFWIASQVALFYGLAHDPEG